MASSEWMSIFESKTSEFEEGHTWRLEFDRTLVPDNPNKGWLQCTRKTSARFRCSKCKRTWPSNRVVVVFHMRLRKGKGVVKVRRLRQNCKKCNDAPMEEPSIDLDNVDILLDSLVSYIMKRYYHEDVGELSDMFKKLIVKSPHEPDHCEACIEGICTQGQ